MTQEQAILKLLQNGHWWKCSELLQEVPCIIHSRIAGLRDKGHRVEHRRVGPGAHGSEYRLVALDAGDALPGSEPSPASSALGKAGAPAAAAAAAPVLPSGPTLSSEGTPFLDPGAVSGARSEPLEGQLSLEAA